MEEWKEYRAKEFCATVTDGTHDSPKPKTTGHYLITSKHLKDNRIDFSSANLISEEDYQKVILRSAVEQYDILFSMIGTIGNTVQVKQKHVDFAVKNMGIFKMGRDELKSTWLYYWLNSGYSKNYINQRLAGSTQSYMTLDSLRCFPIMYPGDKNAQLIVSVLKSLDDKIEVNRKINENLEQQAQALFKSWFVDFGPFKDQPFVESELGMIPQGWRVGKLGELCQFKRGKGLLSKNAIPGTVPVVAGGLEPACYHNISNTKAPVITVSGSGANAGFMRLYHQEVWASDCSFIDVTCENLLFVYCFLAINSHLLKHAQTGAVQPHVKPADIHDFDLVIPPKEIIQRFQSTILPYIRKKGIAEQESRRLAELRDTLLPRLMSGELKVNDIEL